MNITLRSILCAAILTLGGLRAEAANICARDDSATAPAPAGGCGSTVANLATALTNAVEGDVIVSPRRRPYTGHWTLPDKSMTGVGITITVRHRGREPAGRRRARDAGACRVHADHPVRHHEQLFGLHRRARRLVRGRAVHARRALLQDRIRAATPTSSPSARTIVTSRSARSSPRRSRTGSRSTAACSSRTRSPGRSAPSTSAART
jgi:hypothetical protein